LPKSHGKPSEFASCSTLQIKHDTHSHLGYINCSGGRRINQQVCTKAWRVANLHHNFEGGFQTLFRDYFAEEPVFPEEIF
jgi:hypothetical protein